MPTLAAVLFGKHGSFSSSASFLQAHPSCDTQKNNAINATHRFATFIAKQWIQKIKTHAQKKNLSVEFILHSWNPQMKNLLDNLYQPLRSKHEEPMESLDKVQSAHLSLNRALKIMDEAFSEVSPTLVLVSRYDVLWLSNIRLPSLPLQDQVSGMLWLPSSCVPIVGPLTQERPGRSFFSDVSEGENINVKFDPLVSTACGCVGRSFIMNGRILSRNCHNSRFVDGGRLMQLPYLTRFLGQYVGTRAYHSPSITKEQMVHGDPNFYGYVLDYFFLATPKVAHSFSDIYFERESYDKRVSELLPKSTILSHHKGPFPSWAHMYWAVHINEVLTRRGVQIAFLDMLDMRDFVLGRRYRHGPICTVETTWNKTSARIRTLIERVAQERAPPHEAYRLFGGGQSPLSGQCPRELQRGLAIACPVHSPACRKTASMHSSKVQGIIREGDAYARGGMQPRKCFSDAVLLPGEII